MRWLDRFRKRPATGEPTSSSPVYPSSGLPSDLERSFQDTPAVQRYRASRPAALEMPRAAPPAPVKGQKLLLGLIGLGVALLVGVLVAGLAASERHAARLAAVGQAQVQAERLARAAWMTDAGAGFAYAALKDSMAALSRHVGTLRDEPGAALADLGGLLPHGLTEVVAPALPILARADKQVAVLLAQQGGAARAQDATRNVGRTGAELVLLAEALSISRMQAGAAPQEVSALGTALTLAQQISRSALEVAGGAGAQEAAQRGLKDLGSLRAALKVVSELEAARPAARRDPNFADKLAGLGAKADEVESQFSALAGAATALSATREARRLLLAELEPMHRALEAVRARIDDAGGFTHVHLGLLMAALVLTVAGGVGLLRLFVQDQTARARQAEAQRAVAQREQQEAKLYNDATQSAILRLMNELQVVAEGDLTQQCTVTEEITGAIADSVNYTVEELRNLVSQVQTVAGRVSSTTQTVEHTSSELLSASAEQLREIRGTGESVLQMAGRLNDVSAQAQRMADVARQSLQAAAGGLNAVQGAIGGMHAIRDQIQDTSRRIKRLGESSQEIGEITEVITDLTDQTNLLALNAAILAASAGEAGRGFAIVAQEVQRLAERCAQAARQISALVQTIQTDTQDAVAAMEVSTSGVVEGSKLSDAAGAALDDIDRVTHQLSSLVERISAQAQQEASSVNAVAANIQHIFSVTEQTSEGTQSTVQRVRELARSAEELRALVARFKIS
jgi:twitching motility protein PilJ